jgi:calcium-dependent protein kinase
MQAFCNENRLKNAARNVIAKRLAAAEIEDLKQIFQALDKNKDGVVTFQELKNGISNLGGVGKSLLESLTFIDIDWDGVIEYTEFLAAAMSKKKYGEERICWEAFQVFDIDGSGQISQKELIQVLHRQDVEDIMGSVAIARVMEQCDTDGGGTIDFQEFMNMMRSD